MYFSSFPSSKGEDPMRDKRSKTSQSFVAILFVQVYFQKEDHAIQYTHNVKPLFKQIAQEYWSFDASSPSKTFSLSQLKRLRYSMVTKVPLHAPGFVCRPLHHHSIAKETEKRWGVKTQWIIPFNTQFFPRAKTLRGARAGQSLSVLLAVAQKLSNDRNNSSAPLIFVWPPAVYSSSSPMRTTMLHLVLLWFVLHHRQLFASSCRNAEGGESDASGVKLSILDLVSLHCSKDRDPEIWT
jgi:hypothetical protein